MNNFKKILAIILSLCLGFCFAGCAEEDALENYKFSGVQIVEYISGTTYKETINDATLAQNLWDVYLDVEIDETTTAEPGSAWFYMCLFTDEYLDGDDVDGDLGVFAIYDNGACCFEDDDFKVLYTVKNGEEMYEKFVNCYLDYESATADSSSEEQ